MRGRWAVLSVVMLGGLMGPLDGTIVNIALPSIARSFHTDVSAVSWVVTGYLLAIVALLLTWGRLGDVVGLKPVYLAGLGGFGATSALCALAPNLGWLVAARVLQGLAGGLMFALAPSLLARAFSARERGRALGIFGMTTALGLTSGPALGGAIVAAASWRAVFLINLPVSILGVIWGWRVLGADRPPAAQKFDLLGATLATLALASALFALSEGPRTGWASPRVLVEASLALLCTVAFVARERTAADPMLDLAVFRNLTFSSACVAAVLNFAALFTALFLMPFQLQQVRHFPPAQAGLLMSVLPAALFVAAPVCGALSDRVGSRLLTSGGMLITAFALALLALAPSSAGAPDLAWRLLLMGAGLGLFQAPNNSAALGAAPAERLGVTGGILATARNLGMMLGVALGQAVYGEAIASGASPAHALSYALLAGAVVASLGALVAGVRPGGKQAIQVSAQENLNSRGGFSQRH